MFTNVWVTKADTARRLGMSDQAVSYQIKYKKHTESELEVEKIGNKEMVYLPSIYRELARRYSLVAGAMDLTEGTCQCGCGVLTNGSAYIQGHDQKLEGALQTIYKTGTKFDREVIINFAEQRNIDLLKF